MKKNAKKQISLAEAMARLIGGIALFILGIILFILYGAKVIPEGWDSSNITIALCIIWAYSGWFIAACTCCCGISLSRLPIIIKRLVKKNGWLD